MLLLGVGWCGRCSSRKFYTRLLARLAYSHYCLFLQGVSQHLGRLILMASQPCPIWTLTWVLRSVLEGPLNFLMSPAFLEGVPKWSENFLSLYFPRKLLSFSFCPIFSEVSALVARLLISTRLFVGSIFRILFFPKRFPVFSGLQLLSEGLLRICEKFPGENSPWLLALPFRNEEGLLGSLPWYLMGLLW